jgi:fructose-1-phosphate kinase PfkB-like protein
MSGPWTTAPPAPRLLAIGLNSVRQKTLVFPALALGQVNRARAAITGAGGKGAHCARAIHVLAPGAGAVVQFLGGESGAFVGRCLAESGLPQVAIGMAGATRTCTTLLCERTGVMTELVEPSPAVTAREVAELRRRLFPLLGAASGVALCGTLPPGVGVEFYADVARAKGRATLVLDACQGAETVLATGQVDVLKINLAEARGLFGAGEPRALAERCFARFAVRWLALTDGPGDAWLLAPDQAWTYRLPRLERVVNPLGAGDTATGVTLLKLAQGEPVPQAFAWGLAAASASCRWLEGARFDPADLPGLRPEPRPVTA